MALIAPSGPVYQAGTLSGNPVAMAAGLATLEVLARPGVWQQASGWAERAAGAIVTAAESAGLPVMVQRVGTMLTPFFTDRPVRTFAEAKRTGTAGYRRFFHGMLESGVYLPPSPFEAAFTSTQHGETELQLFEASLHRTWRR